MPCSTVVPITLVPEKNIPPPADHGGLPASMQSSISYDAQFRRVTAACAALQKLIALGATVSEDGEVEGEINLAEGNDSGRAVEAFAGGPSLTPREYARPAVLLKLHSLLKEYDRNVVQSADQLRIYVTNKLLLESDEAERSGDRIRALELIGKMQQVGLFTERSETTIKHGTTEELEAVLRNRLKRLIELDKDDYETVGDIVETAKP